MVRTQSFQEGRLRFDFPADWKVLRPGESSYYRRHFQNFCGGCKEADFVLLNPNSRELYLLEVKDYTTDRRTKPSELFDELAIKARDTLALLMAGAVNDTSAPDGVGMFMRVCNTPATIRVILHLEQPAGPSKLFPGVTLESNFMDKLRQKLRCICRHSKVVSTSTPHPQWTCAWNP